MAHIKYVHQASGPSGPLDHVAEAIDFHEPVPGAITVTAHCCDGAHLSTHTFYDSTRMTPEEIESQVREHCKRVAEHHAMAVLAAAHMYNFVRDGRRTGPGRAAIVFIPEAGNAGEGLGD